MIAYIHQTFGSPSSNEIKITLYFFSMTLGTATIWLLMPLYLQEPKFLCKNQNDENKLFPCTQTQACSTQGYIVDYENSPLSMTTEFSWICERNYLKDLIASLTYLSQNIGFLYYTFTHSKNRFSLIYKTQVICILTVIGLSFTSNYLVIVTLITLYYFLVNPLILLSEVIIVDISGENQRLRSWSISFMYTGWGFGSIYIGILGYIHFDWRICFLFYTGIPTLLLCLCFISIRNTKINDNGIQNDNPIHQEDNSHIKSNPLRIFKYRSLRSRIIAGSIISAIGNINYYGTFYIIGTLMGNIYINQILLGTVELIAYLLFGPIFANFKRKTILNISYASIIVIFMMFIFFNQNTVSHNILTTILNVSLAVLGKAFIDINWATMQIYSIEIFPQSVRQEGYGLTHGTVNFLMVLFPQFVTFMKYIGISPYVGLAIMNVFAFLPIYFMPETYGKHAEEYTVEELQQNDVIKLIKSTNSQSYSVNIQV